MPIALGLCSLRMTADIRHMRAFVAIADLGNITRAAASLHVTQPALSRTLRQLEHTVGAVLVDRSTHHLALTPVGRQFLDAAHLAIDAFDRAVAVATPIDVPLRLGHSWSAATTTSALVRLWNAQYPARPIVVRRSNERLGGLATDDVDIALVRGPVTELELQTQLVRHERRLAVVPSDHRLAGHVSVVLADLADQPLVVNSIAGTTSPALWPDGARPTIAVDAATTDDWLIAIASGAGVGVTPESTAVLHPHPDVRFIPISDAPTVPLMLAWPRQHPRPEVAALLRLARHLGPVG
jgi:DNA-binding transcriptional LysR family regulator